MTYRAEYAVAAVVEDCAGSGGGGVEMTRPEVFDVPCQRCGEKAIAALMIEISFDGGVALVPFHLCSTCRPLKVVGTSMAALPSHKDFVLQQVPFPPTRGGWSKAGDGSVTIGCPLCGAMVGINHPLHIDQDGKIQPSFICPASCGLHAWLTLEGWRH